MLPLQWWHNHIQLMSVMMRGGQEVFGVWIMSHFLVQANTPPNVAHITMTSIITHIRIMIFFWKRENNRGLLKSVVLSCVIVITRYKTNSISWMTTDWKIYCNNYKTTAAKAILTISIKYFKILTDDNSNLLNKFH